MTEDRDKKARCNNIIFHRIAASREKDSDNKFVQKLLKKFNVEDTQLKSMQRTGKVENTGPIKSEIKTEEDKSQIMGNLKN